MVLGGHKVAFPTQLLRRTGLTMGTFKRGALICLDELAAFASDERRTAPSQNVHICTTGNRSSDCDAGF